MVKTQLPPIAQNPAHAHVVAACQQLRQNELESFFVRATGSHVAAIVMREIIYWFMPNNRQPHQPRTTVRRDERYWFCRTREEWMAKHQVTRRQLESAYRRCEGFLDVDHFMFAAQRRTHYSIRFERLRELLENDRVLQEQLAARLPEEAQPPGQEAYPAVGTQPSRPSVDSLRSFAPSINQTEPVRVVEPLNAPTVHSAPRLAAVEQEVEELENPPELSNQKVQVILKATEGQPLTQKLESVRSLSPHGKKFLGYLLIWQRVFEKEYPGRRHCFTDQHLSYARDLADQGVPLGAFQDALEAAWEIRGTHEGHDPVFMCRNHSRKFSLFCKHFTRMEEELTGEGLL